MALFQKKNYNGITPDTPKHLQLGAGAIFKNFIIGTDTYATAKAGGKLIGATKDGGKFSAKAAITNIVVDGGGSRVMGFADVSEWEDVSIQANILEMTPAILRDALALADVEDVTTIPALSGYKHIKGRVGIADTDYITNITWVGCVTGSTVPMYIQLRNGFNEDGIALNFKDGDAGVLPVTFHAYNALTEFMTDDVTAPFDIYYPPITSSSAIPAATATGGDQSILLQWPAVTGATKYAVKKYNGATYSTLTDTLESTFYTDTSLTADTVYTYLVQAYVGTSWSPAENTQYNISARTLPSS